MWPAARLWAQGGGQPTATTACVCGRAHVQPQTPEALAGNFINLDAKPENILVPVIRSYIYFGAQAWGGDERLKATWLLGWCHLWRVVGMLHISQAQTRNTHDSRGSIFNRHANTKQLYQDASEIISVLPGNRPKTKQAFKPCRWLLQSAFLPLDEAKSFILDIHVTFVLRQLIVCLIIFSLSAQKKAWISLPCWLDAFRSFLMRAVDSLWQGCVPEWQFRHM